MARYVAPKPDRERSGKGYQSPNQLLGRSVRPQGEGRRASLEVRGPDDMRLGAVPPAEPSPPSGSTAAPPAPSAARIEVLEGELAAARGLERSAMTRLERAEASARSEREVMLVEARTERERLQEELRLERERHDRETAKLRGLVDQRERELRTLALEMGKVQGRLEVAERRLVESGDGAPAGARPAPAARGPKSIERWVLLPILAAVTLFVAIVGWREWNKDLGSEVQATSTLADD